MRLNKDLFERRLGIFFMVLWILIMFFYLTWDGWLYEWRDCGYSGPSQHFDLDITDMQYSRSPDNEITYLSTNNLHNLIYLCYLVFLIGWLGLLFDLEWAKQGAMATMGISFVAALSTLNLSDHVYLLQVMYDLVHLSGVVMGAYLFSKYHLKTSKSLPVVLGTWAIYLVSHLIFTPWPFWENVGQAYFSVNQINDLPFFLFGMEYIVVVVIILAVNTLIVKLNGRTSNRFLRVLIPLGVYFLLFMIMYSTGLIIVQNVNMNTCALR